MQTETKRLFVTCLSLPVPGFPVEEIDPEQDEQFIRVDFITYRGCTYASGAYVALRKKGTRGEFEIIDVALQTHLLRWN